MLLTLVNTERVDWMNPPFFMKYTHILITEDNWPLLGAPSATW